MFHLKSLTIHSFVLIQIIIYFVPFYYCSNVTSKLDYFINEVVIIHKKNGTEEIVTTNEIPLNDENENNEDVPKLFIDYYNDGIRAYLNNDWKLCIHNFEHSLVLYHEYYEGITSCRIRCENERKRFVPKSEVDIDNRHFYESLIYKTLCLERCKRRTLPNIPKYFMFIGKIKEIFKSRRPYEYLQICYYRNKEVDKAVSAVYTAFVMNQNDHVLKKNLEFYSKMDEFNASKVQDFEDKRFSAFYQDALNKYDKKEWEHAIELFEIAIDLWIQDFEKCRAFCEGEYDHGWLPEFTTAVSNHYVYTLRCKTNCTVEMCFVNGHYHKNLIPDLYDYLQYAYYKNNNIKEACQSVASYLLFYPESETMLYNENFYRNLSDVRDEFFEPRPEAITIFYKNFYENELLERIDEEFTKLMNEEILAMNTPVKEKLTKQLKLNEEKNTVNDKTSSYSNEWKRIMKF